MTEPGGATPIDRIIAQWGRERPDLDVSPMRVFGALARANRLMEQRLDVVFAGHGLDSASFDVLATLLRSGAPYRLTAGQLQRAAMITSSAVAQRINRLQGRGLVARTPNPQDARSTDVTLTAQGHEVIAAAVPDHVFNEHRLLAGLTAAQRDQLAELLGVLCAELDKPIGGPGVLPSQPE
jgi:DNA-binding MarR family transcriptional regulator